MNALEADGIAKTFPAGGVLGRKSSVRALGGVSFAVPAGGALGILGESGSGKTTLARIICGLETPDSGEVFIDGKPRRLVPKDELPGKIQMVFQNPYASLNPKLTVGVQIKEAIIRADVPKEERAAGLLEEVGLDGSFLKRFPHQMSGGQRQRAAIARALAPQPEILVADEAVSALDVSIQAQILELLNELRRKTGVTLVFISHDALAAAYVSDEIMVMKDGATVETGKSAEILENPRGEYTALLVSSATISKETIR